MADEKVTTENLKRILDSAYMGSTVDDDGDIYVTEGVEFPMFISILPDQKMIKFYTFINFKDGENVDENKANALVNRINLNFLPNSVYQIDGRLHSACFMTFIGGFSDVSFIEMLRRSASSWRFSITQKDMDDLVA